MVNRDDIIRMAIDAGINEATANFYCAEIGRLLAVEREECAKVCEDIDKEYDGEDVSAAWCASHIRARGTGNESR